MDKDDVPAGHKRCKKCHLVKPFDSFGKETKGKDGLKSRCRLCISSKNKEYAIGSGAEVKKSSNQQYRDANSEVLKENKRLARLKLKYGELYNEYLAHEEIRKNLKDE
ncbi:hypothetical protein ABLV51_19675 [Klebsiella sp. GB_Kp051]|uniref:hypothetical protein n=1 Tax=Klebsiella/Raoultella group TaxID=2890311 RepID=UPI00084A11BB|nr:MULTISPECIES: hypothetical protein [Klebsiella/Raoultella group]AOO59834.1 hypothetical protein AN237_25085 [Raoultella ornithinolytica]EIV6184224.1 hypothetical protein [Klebsiella aerogenes]SMG73046.1 Uncharacterised protein [Klebsiella quasipneumoniae]